MESDLGCSEMGVRYLMAIEVFIQRRRALTLIKGLPRTWKCRQFAMPQELLLSVKRSPAASRRTNQVTLQTNVGGCARILSRLDAAVVRVELDFYEIAQQKRVNAIQGLYSFDYRRQNGATRYLKSVSTLFDIEQGVQTFAKDHK